MLKEYIEFRFTHKSGAVSYKLPSNSSIEEIVSEFRFFLLSMGYTDKEINNQLHNRGK